MILTQSQCIFKKKKGELLRCPWCAHTNTDPVEDWVLKSGKLPSIPDFCEACENVIWVKRQGDQFFISTDKRKLQ